MGNDVYVMNIVYGMEIVVQYTIFKYKYFVQNINILVNSICCEVCIAIVDGLQIPKIIY